MSDSGRVRRLRLSLELDTSDNDEASRWRTQVEQVLIRAVLDACAEALHQRLGPQALVCVRRLQLRLEFDPDALLDPEEAIRQGRLLAERLVPPAGPERGDRLPDPGANLVVFRSEAHRQAVLIAERAAGRAPGWYQGRQPSPRPLADWLGRGPEQVAELLDGVTRLGAADGLFTGDRGLIAALADCLPAERWPAEVLRAAVQLGGSPAAAHSSSSSRSPYPPGPSAADAAVAPGSQVPLRDVAGSRPAPGERLPVPGPLSDDPDSSVAGPEPPRPARALVLDDEGLATGATASGRVPRSIEPSRPAVMRRQGPATDGASPPGPGSSADQGRHRGHGPVGAEAGGEVGEETGNAKAQADSVPLPGLTTAFGGLFYLVGRVLELELGEQLWCAGLREGEVLYQAARLLIGPAGAGDPAAAVFAGLDPEAPIPVPLVEDWALAEVRGKLLGTLEAALFRRLGQAAVARPITAELEALAGDLLQRLPIGADAASAALIGLAAAAPALLFLRRAGMPETPMALDAALAVPATLLLPQGQLLVTMPMAAIDLDLRRAGLDQNPGWVPWLGRKVELQYL